MAYIEGAYEVRPGDAVEFRVDGVAVEGAVIARISRLGVEVECDDGRSFALGFQATNEAIWERGRDHLVARVT